MEIIIASKSGFCFGVRRAIKAAQDTKGDRVYSLGDIIHNRHVVKDLEKIGVKRIDSIDNLKAGDTVIIRSHGESPKIFDELEKRRVSIVDTTCPYVMAAQNHGKILSKQGYEVIILGTPGHPEVIGLVGHSRSERIISTPEEVDNLDVAGKIAVIAQTTLSRQAFRDIVEKIQKRYPEAIVIDTICSATKERQDAAVRLARTVDIMVVVGGKHSSNTSKLAELCKKIVETHLVEDASDLDPSWFRKSKKVGVAAGASTPEKIIHETVEKIRSFGQD